jgi:hypothetical protein
MFGADNFAAEKHHGIRNIVFMAQGVNTTYYEEMISNFSL